MTYFVQEWSKIMFGQRLLRIAKYSDIIFCSGGLCPPRLVQYRFGRGILPGTGRGAPNDGGQRPPLEQRLSLYFAILFPLATSSLASGIVYRGFGNWAIGSEWLCF